MRRRKSEILNFKWSCSEQPTHQPDEIAFWEKDATHEGEKIGVNKKPPRLASAYLINHSKK